MCASCTLHCFFSLQRNGGKIYNVIQEPKQQVIIYENSDYYPNNEDAVLR